MWAFPSADRINSVEDWFDLLGYDAEVVIPEEDLNHVQRIINTPLTYREAVTILTGISVIPVADLEMIRHSKDIEDLKSISELSIATKYLVNSIQFVDFSKIKLAVKEKLSFQNGVRHDWRANGSSGKYDFGILLEKDPGEKHLADHNSIYLKWNSTNLKIIAGDHQLIGGYGLIAWRTMAVHKGFETVNTLSRQGKGIKGYRSSNEYWSTRGFGADIATNYGKFSVSLGKTYKDGSLQGGELKLDKTGLHVTSGDYLLQNQLLEDAVTIMWINEFSPNQMGVLLNRQNIFDDEDSNIRKQSISIFTSGNLNDWHWFGEGAFSDYTSPALLGGALYRKGPIKYLISLRYYPTNFRTYRTQPLTEWQGQNDGEQGIFQNVKLNYENHVLSFFSDIAEKIEASVLSTSNNIKYESGVKWQWRNKKHQIRAQMKKSNQLNNTQTYVPNTVDHDISHSSVKGYYLYRLHKKIDIRWQINSTLYNEISEGLGIETRIDWKPPGFVITASLITAQVDDYNSRLYFWDLNLPGEMRSVAISETRQLLGLRIQLKNNNNYRLYARWRATWDNINFVGTAEQIYAFAIQINF